MPFHELKNQYLYPEFIKESIFHLPGHVELRAEFQ
jgi:hypothetical protein